MKKASIIMAVLACAIIAAAYTNSVPISTNTRAATEKWTAIRFEPALPPTPENAASKFLNGNREWQTVAADADLAALRTYHYGSPDIVESPAGWFVFDGAGTITMFNWEAGRTNVVIPWAIGGVPVTAIGEGAFQTSGILSVIAPQTVTAIGDTAFNGCYFLTSVSLPQATAIGGNAFADCGSLTSVSLPQATAIGVYAFAYCNSLTSVTLPKAQTIGNYAFADCPSLTSVHMGRNAPAEATGVFNYITQPPTVYVTDPQATGWGAEWNGAPVVRPPMSGSNVTAQAFTLNGDTITEWPAGGATNITDGVTSGAYSEATRTIDISNLLAGVSMELPDGIVTNGMGGLLLATNATGASFVNISGSGGGWGNALQVDGSIYMSNWGASQIRFPNGGYVSSGVFYGGTSEMGFKSWMGAEKWVIRSLTGNVYIDNGSLTVAGTNTAAEVRSTGGYIIGPTISGKQAHIFTDGTNCFFVNVNSVTNALTNN